MRTLDRYVALQVLGSAVMTLLVLLALTTFVQVIDELGDLGKGTYDGMAMARYVALTTPRRAYEMLPMAALLGALLGLGGLASSSELTVMRAAGVSPLRLTTAVLYGGAVLMLLGVVLGEVVIPRVETTAEERRALAITGQLALKTEQGFWARDGSSFVNIQEVLPDRSVAGVMIYEFDAERRLRVASSARRGHYREGAWELEGLVQTEFLPDRVERRELDRAQWQSSLEPGLLSIAVVRPERLSVMGLWRYVTFLEANGQNSGPYRLAFWVKLMMPVATGVMLFLAVPFVFGPLRSVGVGQRLVVGSLMGIGFYILNQTLGQIGIVFDLSPLASATLPTLGFAVFGLWLLYRVR